MEISTQNKQEIGETKESDLQLGFSFDHIPFQGFSEKTKENLTRWGLAHSLQVRFLRFNIAFSDLQSQKFLQDLVKSEEFQTAFPAFATQAKKCNKVSFNKLRVTMLNTNFVDTLEQEGLIRKGGRISPTFGEVVHSVEIVNLIRDAWLNEDGEHYTVFDDEMRRELLVQLFNMLVIGGQLNQYDDMVDPYRECVKEFYKEIVSVRKDGSNGSVYCESTAYQITAINDEDVFGWNHPQSKLVVVVNPSKRECVVVKNKWDQIGHAFFFQKQRI